MHLNEDHFRSHPEHRITFALPALILRSAASGLVFGRVRQLGSEARDRCDDVRVLALSSAGLANFVARVGLSRASPRVFCAQLGGVVALRTKIAFWGVKGSGCARGVFVCGAFVCVLELEPVLESLEARLGFGRRATTTHLGLRLGFIARIVGLLDGGGREGL